MKLSALAKHGILILTLSACTDPVMAQRQVGAGLKGRSRRARARGCSPCIPRSRSRSRSNNDSTSSNYRNSSSSSNSSISKTCSNSTSGSRPTAARPRRERGCREPPAKKPGSLRRMGLRPGTKEGTRAIVRPDVRPVSCVRRFRDGERIPAGSSPAGLVPIVGASAGRITRGPRTAGSMAGGTATGQTAKKRGATEATETTARQEKRDEFLREEKARQRCAEERRPDGAGSDEHRAHPHRAHEAPGGRPRLRRPADAGDARTARGPPSPGLLEPAGSSRREPRQRAPVRSDAILRDAIAQAADRRKPTWGVGQQGPTPRSGTGRGLRGRSIISRSP